MLIISDSTPLIALSRIGQLNVLQKLYQSIAIPHAVFQEVVVESQGRSGSNEVLAADWIVVYDVDPHFVNEILQYKLDYGETEAIALAAQIGANIIIADEIRARKAIVSRGIKVIGTIGVLIQAKQNRLIDQVLPLVDQLRNNGFHLSTTMYQDIRHFVDE